jgi:hypothetical protein
VTRIELLDALLEYVRRHKVSALIHYGAGDIELAIPLSQSVKEYVAVEGDVRQQKALQNANIRPIRQRFPSQPYDGFVELVILAPKYADSVAKVKGYVGIGGAVLVITRRGSDWKLEEHKR